MKNVIIERKIVKGTRGIALFAMEHLDDIRKGCYVNFEVRCPQTFSGDIKNFEEESESCYGIVVCKTSELLDNPHTILYIDRYGGSLCPELAPIDSSCSAELNAIFLAETIQTIAECEEGNRIGNDQLIYVEVVEN